MSKIVYHSSIKDFIKCVTGNCNAFLMRMQDNFEKYLGFEPGDSEVKSWENNAKALSKLFADSSLKDSDAYIGFEYLIPVGGRIDCVLFGRGLDDAKNMVHIELKQWSNENVTEYYSGCAFSAQFEVGGNRGDARLCSHPSAQANEYHNHLLNYIAVFDDCDIHLTGFAYCYEYDSNGNNNVLCNKAYDYVTKKCRLFCKDNADSLKKDLEMLLGKGDGATISDAIINSEVHPTKRLQDAAKNMFDGEIASAEFSLIGEQLDAYNAILGAIKNTDPNKKTVVVVKGGPGTGKSVIAMRLVSGLAKTGKFRNVFYSTRSTSLLHGYKDILKNVSYADGNDCAAIDLIKKNVTIKPNRIYKENSIDALIVDEAHRIEQCANDMNDTDKSLQTHLTQLMAMLFVSRVCVLFIDDHQSIHTKEIGTSENIIESARKYFSIIQEENERYRNCDFPKLTRQIEQAKKRLDEYKKEGDEEIIRKYEKKIKSLEGEFNNGNKWLENAEPKIKDVQVLEFSLADQFRCNGSNNYLNWLEWVIYKDSHFKRAHLDKSSYTFQVFDTPQEVYSKVRSLDDYAKYEDKQRETMDKFSYEKLNKSIKRDNFSFDTSARLIAGWCWEWVDNQLKDDGDLLHEVSIPNYDFAMPWETKKRATGDFRYKYAINADSWCNQNEGVNQVGCIHSIQGWETDYVGVIIGPDLKYDKDNDCLVSAEGAMNYDISKTKSIKGTTEETRLIRNIYRVLLTRGKKGCFVFACDKGVRDYLRRCMNNE